MDEFLSKIENFIFDILGLILPGFIFLGVLVIPLSLVDITQIPCKELDNSYILSELSTISNLFKNYWNEKSNIIIISIIILAYLLGHFVKVFSIIKYEILVAVFDKSINKLVAYLYSLVKSMFGWIYQKMFNESLFSTKGYSWLKDLFKPIKNTLSKIFTFKSEDYFTDNTSLRTECITIINTRLSTNYPDKWYSLYKFSTVITNQESIKSMAAFFLAKYNLYRSLAFIFMFAAFYYNIFFNASAKYTSSEIHKLSLLILITTGVLWFTFHYKYKRYWTLCGNETLVSLYYFLNKKNVNDK
ncbi:hypothetical protein NAT51_03645 [Flavobacterium amniphilum]|uniref:hypothetical protein n=1 Tax=Flavobacterium amniphilum TaxID=1834035 RepID=UPI00202AAB74|nr:hypothetical protein [Flavobacterium amniphilum]MCL9804600.1 hypothetical protein [Flavobacterium amniphilum]